MADYTETIANTLGIIGILEVKSYTIRLIAIFALVYGDDCALKPAPILTFPLGGRNCPLPLWSDASDSDTYIGGEN